MKTFDISLAQDFDKILFLRERDLCAVLDARERPGFAADDPHDVTDFEDVAASQAPAAVDEAQAEQAALELEQVLAARHRLRDHSYGRCLGCDEPIDLARLSAMPAAANCLACQTTQEKVALRATLQ